MGDILKSQITSLAGKKFSSSFSLQGKWVQIVGPAIARHSQILYVKNDTLLIGVDNSTWHNELVLMKENIIKKIGEISPDVTIKELKFKIRVKE